MATTRRDFVNGTLLGAGASLLSSPAPANVRSNLRTPPPIGKPSDDWYGFGGIGDYATSHGNTPTMVEDAHHILHGIHEKTRAGWKDTGEIFDIVVVGGGLAGLGAAYDFVEAGNPSKTCLILDNHPVFGGEAKQNEFLVDGHLLRAPQGSNGFSIPSVGDDELAYASGDAYYYDRLGVPREFSYSEATNGAENIRFGNDSYGFLHWLTDRVDISHFNGNAEQPEHRLNVMDKQLANLQVSDATRSALLAWHNTTRKPHPRKGLEAWLDQMSIKDYLEKQLGLDPVVTRYLDPIIASGVGGASDAVSAFILFATGLPGFGAYHNPYLDNRHSFPGGNTGFVHHFVKRIMPRAITGTSSFEDILNGAIQFDQLDKKGESVRMRLSSTVIDVTHDSNNPDDSDCVWVSYVADGQIRRIRARSVVMASGGWVNRHVVRGLPAEQHAAFDSFNHVPFLVANVALTNWQFMHKLGISACRYDGSFGFSCNIKRPMVVGDRQEPHDPDKPAVLSFYVPFYNPGMPVEQQGTLGRMQLFTTSYASYESQIIAQMNELFAASGFNAKRDVAGIVLNRWGHAYIVPEPGFFFAPEGHQTAAQTASSRFGRIGFGHGELVGMQHWGPAAAEGRRAFHEVKNYFL